MSTLVNYIYSLDGLPALSYPIALLPSGTANTPSLGGVYSNGAVYGGVEPVAHRNEASARAYCRAHYRAHLSTLRWVASDPTFDRVTSSPTSAVLRPWDQAA
jgi:hypothetical protein